MPNILDTITEELTQQRQLITPLADRLERIEQALQVIAQAHTVKDLYTTEEFATIVKAHPQTIRQHCVNQRIKATKLPHGGRGNVAEWRISHKELQRYQNEGLLPARAG